MIALALLVDQDFELKGNREAVFNLNHPNAVKGVDVRGFESGLLYCPQFIVQLSYVLGFNAFYLYFLVLDVFNHQNLINQMPEPIFARKVTPQHQKVLTVGVFPQDLEDDEVVVEAVFQVVRVVVGLLQRLSCEDCVQLKEDGVRVGVEVEMVLEMVSDEYEFMIDQVATMLVYDMAVEFQLGLQHID